MMLKNCVPFIALFLSVLTFSCTKSSNLEETEKPPAETKSFSIKVGNTAYNLDSLNVIETSSGYYIRATQKGAADASYGVSIFVNSKTSGTNVGYGDVSEAGKAYVSGSLGAGQSFSSSYTNPTTGNVTTSSGGINISVTNGVLTVSFHSAFFNATGESTSISVSLRSPLSTDTPDEPNNQFFDFEFNGATYNLHSLVITPYDKGFFIMGVISHNQGVTLVINTKTSNTSVSFGDMEESGKSGAVFNIPSDEIYGTTGRDCHGRNIVHNQGQAKITSIGNVGGYIEGTISGAAFKSENACNRDEKKVESKSFRGFFKIRRLI